MFALCLRHLGWARPTARHTDNNGSGHDRRAHFRNHRYTNR
jgi:hypothetical protein